MFCVVLEPAELEALEEFDGKLFVIYGQISSCASDANEQKSFSKQIE